MKGILNPKNIFSQKTPLYKGVLVIALVAIAGTLLFAPEPANAAFWDDWIEGIFNALLGLLVALISIIVAIIAFIVNLLLIFIVWIARMFMETALELTLTYPYTSSAAFKAGWSVMRDLANMSLVIVFVAIGVGTMLNLQTINKRMLGRFFIVAVLINFTPIITGIIIDLSNIAGFVFWNSAKTSSSALVNTQSALTGQVGDLFSRIIAIVGAFFDGADYPAMIGVLVQSVISIVMNLVLIFVYMLLFFLFIGRTIMLSLLVIISPIAFIGLIFKR